MGVAGATPIIAGGPPGGGPPQDAEERPEHSIVQTCSPRQWKQLVESLGTRPRPWQQGARDRRRRFRVTTGSAVAQRAGRRRELCSGPAKTFGSFALTRLGLENQ